MIPLWKIQREVMRIGAQIKNLPTAIVDLYELTQEPKLRRAHFAKLHERIALTDGQAPETDRVAILLIYQPAGLAESTIILCQDLINNGFSPFVVTNSPLSDTDSTKLEAWCWKLMTRPNFGYDFGGYQDALLTLRNLVPDANAAIIMNDSVWLNMDQALIAMLQGAPTAVVGLVQESKLRTDNKNNLSVDLQNLQSYFYFIHRGFWQDPQFWRFWQDYMMVSSKKRTIKAGELGFTKYLVANDIPHQALISKTQFLDQIKTKNSDYLRFVLRYAVYTNPHLAAERDALIACQNPSASWHEATQAHIRQTLIQEPLNGSFWVAACDMFGVTVIKKNKDALPEQMRKAFLAAHQDGAIALSPDIAAEIAASLRRD
ncbi:rhamnan synthesis F family protein [Yoonia sp.]|jgi:hypothetical protein|uniref:rhamnan synthesis F family protein n=1 Tax=Yoonia sp. TaxID=2212373 RepID=UPI004047EE4C